LQRMVTAYSHYGPACLDLAEAVQQQGSFIEKMADLGWTKPGCFEDSKDFAPLLSGLMSRGLTKVATPCPLLHSSGFLLSIPPTLLFTHNFLEEAGSVDQMAGPFGSREMSILVWRIVCMTSESGSMMGDDGLSDVALVHVGVAGQGMKAFDLKGDTDDNHKISVGRDLASAGIPPVAPDTVPPPPPLSSQ
ncbi:1653_t:CDS:2, partial [Acaulospora colombiana]